MPYKSDETDRTITVRWNNIFSTDNLGDDVQEYILSWDRGSNGRAWSALPNQSGTSYTVQLDDVNSRTYKFKLNARNSCGISPDSDILTVTLAPLCT